MPKVSAGLLLYRSTEDGIAVLLVHPGGPFWRKRDLGAWSIPKGEAEPGEDLAAAAAREFSEELGAVPDGAFVPLGRVRQRGGKDVEAFALEADFDVSHIRSNTFEMEWPPRSGLKQAFPEVDRAEWFALPLARRKILGSQLPILDRLERACRGEPD
ncbi:NUDIX domain-containing protein [Faunimonas sp. B44]|uniref:NUDIX domain-containing protein n=1 Tax=Faunimonas sp. B44 TaxID=3461493 RepID=UPI004044D1A6